jgi:hypothetical protein
MSGSRKPLKAAGICHDPKMKVYVLWTLKLMSDSPSIFESVKFLDLTNPKQAPSEIKGFDIVILDE